MNVSLHGFCIHHSALHQDGRALVCAQLIHAHTRLTLADSAGDNLFMSGTQSGSFCYPHVEYLGLVGVSSTDLA